MDMDLPRNIVFFILCSYIHTVSSASKGAGANTLQSLFNNINLHRSRTSGARAGKGMSVMKNNCTTNCPTKRFNLDYHELLHINRVKHEIMRKLGITENENGKIDNVFEQPKKTRDSFVPKPTPSVFGSKPKPTREYFPEFSEIISFSENAVNTSDKNMLSFAIDIRSNKADVEAMSAHLWILVRKRRYRKRNRGKKIFLQVLRVRNDTSQFISLTSLKTRVKKTRWQKVSLPVTFIQSVLDSNDRHIQLRVVCKRCGKVVRPVLHSKKKKIKRKRRKGKKNRRRKKSRRYRDRKLRHGERELPFLVISTRYNHRLNPPNRSHS